MVDVPSSLAKYVSLVGQKHVEIRTRQLDDASGGHAGEKIAFKGSYSLVDSKLDLSTQLPLKLLGSAVGKELEGARGALDPNMLVPISIKGTWNKPKVALGDGFLEKALKDAGGDVPKKGLEGLLGGKKDKKPDKKKDG